MEEKKFSLNPLFVLEEDYLLELNKLIQEFLLRNSTYSCEGKTSLLCLKNLKGPKAQDKKNLLLYEIFLIAQKYAKIPDCFFQKPLYVKMMQEIRFIEGFREYSKEIILRKHQNILNEAYTAFSYVKTHCTGNEVKALK